MNPTQMFSMQICMLVIQFNRFQQFSCIISLNKLRKIYFTQKHCVQSIDHDKQKYCM